MEKLYELLFPNVKIADLQWIALCLAVVICGLFCFLMYRIYGKFKLLQEANYGQQLYQAAEDSFRQGNRDRYEKLQKWLKSIGAGYSVKGFEDPFQFVVVNLLVSVGVLVVFSALSDLLTGFLVAAVLIATELMMLVLIDQKNNREMLDDVSFLYDATAIQLTSNIYMVEAISNCLQYIRNKRLKQALTEIKVVTRDGEEIINLQEPVSRWFYEVQEIVKIVQAGDYEACYRRLDVTLDVMEVLENTRKAAGIYFTGEE